MTDQAQRTEWAVEQFRSFVNSWTAPAARLPLADDMEHVRNCITAIAPPMSNPVVGYAVFAELPAIERESGFEYQPVSAVFEELQQAENAHGYCAKRALPSPSARYVICAVQQIST